MVDSAESVVAEVGRCHDFRYFLRHAVFLAERNALGEVTGLTKWQWWPTHDQMLNDLEQRRLAVLKARQLGWSWLLAAKRLHSAMYTPHYLGGVSSAGEVEAKEFIWKCRFIWENLPWAVKPALATDNELELEFGATHGRIIGFPSTLHAGRGFTFSDFVADEAAFHRYASANYAAYSPAIEGQIVLVSSAGAGDKHAVSDWFQRMWVGGSKDENGYRSTFYSWQERPGRDHAWYDAKRAELATEPGQLEREFPNNPSEAFRSMLLLRFDAAAIDAGLEYARANPPLAMPPGLPPTLASPHVHVWVTPQPARAYVLGIDGAEGKGLDYTVTHVLDARSLRHVASIRERVLEPGEHGELSAAMAKWYNDAWCIVERSHGEAIIAVLHARGCKLYRHKEDPASERPGTLGFPMTVVTRPGMLADLAQAITGGLTSADASFWQECATFVVGERRAEAAAGMHDDSPMAMSLAVRMAGRPEGQRVREIAPSERHTAVGGAGGYWGRNR